jgi:hypothetical protein
MFVFIAAKLLAYIGACVAHRICILLYTFTPGTEVHEGVQTHCKYVTN